MILIEAGPRISPTFAEKLSDKATRDLEPLGVTVWTNTMVTSVTAERRGPRRRVECSPPPCCGPPAWPRRSSTAALGVEPRPPGPASSSRTDCSIPGHREVFVIGDQAHLGGGARQAAAARPGPGGDPAGPPRRSQHPARAQGQAARAVPLPRQGPDGDHRPAAARSPSSPAWRSPASSPGWPGRSSASTT